MKRLLLAAIASILICVPAFPYAIKGRIVDERNGAPIWKAEIIARNDSAKFLAGLNSDQQGYFITADIEALVVKVEISKENFETAYLQLSGAADGELDLGTITLKPQAIELGEVQVTAQTVIQKPDKYIVIPTSSEVERSSTSLSLLNALKMKMPGLKVIEELQSVTVDNRVPVFKINGKSADLNKVLSINNENILRIEYSDNPDIRYNASVINFVLKPRQDGGSVAANLSSALTTGSLDGSLGASYFSKKSEWDINYSINWRDYNERVVNSSSAFYGGENTVKKETLGTPSGFGYTDNYLSIGYTYMHDPGTMFSVTIGGITDKMHENDASSTAQTREDESLKYDSRTIRHTKIKTPNIDLFLRKDFSRNQSIELDLFSRYNNGDYDREYHDAYEDNSLDYEISSITSNKTWGAGGEAMYSKQTRNFTLRLGVRDRYSHADNSYLENLEQSLDNLASNNLYFYGQIIGRIKDLGYTAGIGGVHVHAADQANETNSLRAKATLTLNYPVSKKFTLNYLFMYEPSAPSLYQQSDVIQRVDGISLRQGNMSLRPQEWYRNRIYARYEHKKFGSVLWVSHSRTNNPIFYDYSYLDDESSPYYGMFLGRPVNGCHDDRINLELNLGFNGLFNHFSFEGTVGYDWYELRTEDSKYYDRRVYASVDAVLFFGSWSFIASYKISPQYSLSGNTFTRDEQWNTIKAQYKWRNFHFGLTLVNIFDHRGWRVKGKTLSQVHPEVKEVYINSNGNMLLLSVSYRTNFGKGFKKSDRSLQSGGVDTGVNIAY